MISSVAQIERNVTNLLNVLSKETFVYDLLRAYGKPKNTITLLQKGTRNLSKKPDCVLLKKTIFFQSVKDKHVKNVFDTLCITPPEHDPRFIIVTDYQRLLALDSKTELKLDIPIQSLPQEFEFFLPLGPTLRPLR